VRALSPTHLDYSRLTGLLRLREAIAEQVRSRGTSCDAQQVLIVAGAQRGIDLVFHLLLDAGDLVWIEEPGYPGAHSALLSAGAHAVCMPVDEEGMIIGQQPSGQAEAHLAYVTPSHQFPLGVPMSLARRHDLLTWASDSLAWILEDDYDCIFRYDAQPLPCLHALDPDGRVIYAGTFSKTVFPALRLGFLIVPSDLVEGFVRARVASDVHPPLLEQMILSEFMTRGHYERHIRRMQAEYAERLYALRAAVERTGAPLRLRPVHSGLHAVADLEGVDAERVFTEASARNIEVTPLSAYYYGGGQRQNALLLGFGACRPAAIRAGMWQLAAAIDAARRSPH
jgi:GntR family transcriptional regulator / MocR family aminotransferase